MQTRIFSLHHVTLYLLLTSILLLLMITTPAHSFAEDGWTKSYGSYTFRFTPAGEEREGVLVILKEGKKVYEAESHRFMLGGVDDESALPLGTSVTGRKVPEAVVVEWTGGAHCCFIFHLFEIGNSFREIAGLYAGNSDISEFKDLDGDGSLEFITYDWTFQYWKTAFAFSPAPRVVFRFEKDGYVLATEMMRKPVPKAEEFEAKVREVLGDESWKGAEPSPPPELWGYMLELIYSGHPDKAAEFLKKAWPAAVSGRDEFQAEFTEQLETSPNWKALERSVRRGITAQ